jgi:rhodanese-related sulfurtransferase/polyisoprenoid-binding protein YceI
MNCTIDASGLARRMEESSDLTILDVLLPEHYQNYHIPGALNACVYEVVFIDTVQQIVPDKKTPIVVYDTSQRSQASAWAAQKLAHNGYLNVCQLTGGLEGWVSAGLPLEPKGAHITGEPGLLDGRYRIDTGKSLVTWTGRNLVGRHTGNLSVASGELTIAQGELAGGRIAIDMKSIVNLDLQQDDYRNMLISHLISEDFFEVSRYPGAEAHLKGWRPIPEATPGRANYQIDADLTIKGITHPVQFAALIAPQEDCIKAQAALDIDRTAWNVTYGSGKLFERLGMHLVNDIVTLEFFLVALK